LENKYRVLPYNMELNFLITSEQIEILKIIFRPLAENVDSKVFGKFQIFWKINTGCCHTTSK